MSPDIKRIGIILLVSGVVAGVANLALPRKMDGSGQVEARAAKQNIRVIPLSVALEKFKFRQSVFIDVRSVEEYGHSHIPDALSIHLSPLSIAGYMEARAEFIVYGRDSTCIDALSYTSGQLTGGHAKVSILDGGFVQWKAAEGSVAKAGQ